MVEFSKNTLLLVATVLLAAFVSQSAGHGHHLKEKVSKTFADSKLKFDHKAAVGGDGNIVIQMGQKAISEIHKHALLHHRPGPIGEAINVFTAGWEKTLKLVADALDEAFDLIDYILSHEIKDKTAALNAINNGMNDVRSMIYSSGVPVHSCMGAGKSMANITDRGEFKFAIDKVQETGTGLFDDIDAAQFFATQALRSSEPAITKKCLVAAHAAIKSSAETANTNFLTGALSAFEYLHNASEDKITEHDPSEKIISDAAKTAAAKDSDTVTALEGLQKEFANAASLGINPVVLAEIKEGLIEYIEHSAWSVAICYDALDQAKILAKTDIPSAIRAIENAVQIAKSVLIDGSVKAYESLGAAGRMMGSVDFFQDGIEIAERSRVEGTKGFEAAKTVVIRGILTGPLAAEHAADAAHKMLEANEAVIFGDVHSLRHATFNAVQPGAMEDDTLASA